MESLEEEKSRNETSNKIKDEILFSLNETQKEKIGILPFSNQKSKKINSKYSKALNTNFYIQRWIIIQVQMKVQIQK